MKMTKAASKVAAILCAAAFIVPTGAMAVSADTAAQAPAFASVGDSVPSWTVTSVTGDQYVKIGSTFSFTVNVGYWVNNATYQWQVAYYGTNYNWQNISGATGATLKGTMTSKFNGAHIRCVVKDVDRGRTEESVVRTLSSLEASAKLGTPVKESDGYYKIPLTITGLKNNTIGSFCPKFTVNTASIDGIEFEYSDNWVQKGDNAGFNFFQQNNPIDDDGDGKTDRVEKVANQYRLQYATVMTPAILGSDNVFGYLYVKPKSGVTSLDIKMAEDDHAALYGDDAQYEGNVIYGMTYTGTKIGGSSSSSATYPTNVQVQYSEAYHQVRFTWDKVAGADRYGIAVYLAGKWRIQTQSLTSTSYTTPKNMTPGKTYKVAIAARVNGTWDVAGAIKNAVTVTVK